MGTGSQRQKVELWLPGTGKKEEQAIYCVISTEFQFGKMKSLAGGQRVMAA